MILAVWVATIAWCVTVLAAVACWVVGNLDDARWLAIAATALAGVCLTLARLDHTNGRNR